MPTPETPPFTVSVEAAFDETGTWIIDARLSWRDDPPPLGSALMGRGRIALLRGIAQVGLQGRSLGATKVRVRMEGHGVESIWGDLEP